MQLASYEILGDAALINQQSELYRNITVDDILQVAQEIFRPGNRNTLNYFSNKKPLS
jgi:zinc protease